MASSLTIKAKQNKWAPFALLLMLGALSVFAARYGKQYVNDAANNQNVNKMTIPLSVKISGYLWLFFGCAIFRIA